MNSVHEQCPNSNPNSDLNSALHQAACPMSRPHCDVATSRQPEACRDIQFMSRHHPSLSRLRPPGDHPMSRHHIGVATPLSPLHVATSNLMSRHRLSCPASSHCCPCRDVKIDVATSSLLSPLLLRRDAFLPCCDVLCSHPCRDLKHDVATSTPTCCYSARLHPMS